MILSKNVPMRGNPNFPGYHGEFGGLQMYAYGPTARPGNAVAKEREE